MASKTVEGSHVGTEGGLGGFSILAPLREWVTRLFFHTDWPVTGFRFLDPAVYISCVKSIFFSVCAV